MIDIGPAIGLPVFRRRSIAFEEAFGVSAAAAVRAMDAAGEDLVAERPAWAIGLTSVGCQRDRLLVHVSDPFDRERTAVAICSASIATAVPADRRGLHVSRLGDAIAKAVQRSYPDVAAFAEALALTVDTCQYGGPTTVRVDATVPYLETLPAETRGAKESLEHLSLQASATTGAAASMDVGLRVTHLVACPCVQRTAIHARPEPAAIEPAFESAPGFTHAQRCVTTIAICGASHPLPVPRLLGELDGVLCRTTNTLPRGSELLLVFRAHRSPQFVEDAVRDALAATYRALDRSATFTALAASSRSLESIHDFDLVADARVSQDEARRVFEAASATTR